MPARLLNSSALLVGVFNLAPCLAEDNFFSDSADVVSGAVGDVIDGAVDVVGGAVDILELPMQSVPDFDDGYLTIYYDNDLFGGTDVNYTNGMRASWISRSRDFNDITGVQELVARVSGLDDDAKFDFNYGFSLTQFMFTPEDILVEEPLPGQRPYAGWLGVGFSLHAKTAEVLNSLELSIGVVGPNSLAENAQDMVHNIRDIPVAEGWDNQLPTEFTLNLHFTQKGKLITQRPLFWGLESDAIWQWGFDAGNFQTGLRAGGIMRVGWNLPVDFSPAKLDLNAYTHQLFDERFRLEEPWSLFGTLALEGRGLAYDVLLDGTAFSDSLSVDKKYLVGDLSMGFGVRYKRLTSAYTHTFRTSEYETQETGQNFGSFSFSWAF